MVDWTALRDLRPKCRQGNGGLAGEGSLRHIGEINGGGDREGFAEVDLCQTLVRVTPPLEVHVRY